MKLGDKVRVTAMIAFGREGVIVAIVKDSWIVGLRKRRWKEYIVQFKDSWSYFRAKELEKINRKVGHNA